MKYHRLTQEERYQIAALIQSGFSIRKIAHQLDRSPSTISREVRRNSGRKYFAKRAQELSFKRRQGIGPAKKIRGQLKAEVMHALQEDWSPEQIAGRFRLESRASASHETIYRFLYSRHQQGDTLFKHLRRHRRWRKTQAATRNFKNIGIRRDRTWLDKRPAIVDQRIRLGDFERDTVIGKRGGAVLLTIVDRVSRLTRIAFIERRDGASIHRATVKMLKSEIVNTITNDNGAEFALHEETAKQLGVGVYFTRPFRSWERGTNENTNGLIRQYFPKKTIIQKQNVKIAEHRLNNRPRKCLGYKTPLEVHRELKSSVALSA